MFATKRTHLRAYLAAAAVMNVAFGLFGNHARAATSYYFDINGSAPGLGTIGVAIPYDWDDTSTGGLWNTSSAGTGTNSAWFGTTLQGGFPRFTSDTSGIGFIVDVSNDEQIAGMYMTTAGTMTIGQTAATSGDLNISVSGYQGFIGVSGSNIYIGAPITGVGGLAPEGTGANLYLYGNNSYSGGTQFGDSGSPLTYFSSDNSFGTGPMQLNGSGTSFAAIISVAQLNAPGTITLPNNWLAPTNSGAGINFANGANVSVVDTGTWTLGAKSINIRNNGDASAPLTLSGAISGTGGVVFSGANGGTIILGATESYSGSTTVGVTSDAKFILELAAANALASSSSIVMAGGTLNPDGINQTMSTTTMGMSVSSTLDYSAGASEVDFASSSAVAWTAGTVLNLANWTFGIDALRFGTDATGLTSAQLADIEFNGDSSTLGTAMLNSSGFVAVPEPASICLLGLGAMSVLARRRK